MILVKTRFTLIALVTLPRFKLYFPPSLLAMQSYVPSKILTRNYYAVVVMTATVFGTSLFYFE